MEYKIVDNKKIELTETELAEYNAMKKTWSDERPARQLRQIKRERLEKLLASDYMANSDFVMPDNIKTWRQNLRNIPQNYSEDKYSELLARDSDGKLTHTVWEKP